MEKAFSGVGAFLPYALTGLLIVEALLGLKSCYLHYCTARQQALQAHSVEIEAQDGGGYSVVE